MPNTIKTITKTIVTDTSAYADGDFMGTAILDLSGAAGVGGLVLESITLTDLDKQNKPLDFLFWTGACPNTTLTNNGLLDIHDTDLLTFAGHATLSAADYTPLNDNSAATRSGIGLALNLGSDGKLYCTPVSRGTGTYSASGLQVKFTFLRD